MERAFVLVTGAAIVGLIVLRPQLVAALLNTLRAAVTNGFSVARR